MPRKLTEILPQGDGLFPSRIRGLRCSSLALAVCQCGCTACTLRMMAPGTRHGSLGRTGRQGLPASSSLCASIFLQSKWSFACCPASSLASRKVKINHACGHAQNYARRKGMVFGGGVLCSGEYPQRSNPEWEVGTKLCGLLTGPLQGKAQPEGCPF